MENIKNDRQYYNHMEHRDIHNNNEYIKVDWSDIINEPTGVRSADFSWNLSYKIYTKSQSCCYKSLAYILGPIFALWFGLSFGCQSFMHIWCYQPCLSRFRIRFSFLQRLNIIILDATCVPLMKACSNIFSNVNVRYEKMTADFSPAHRQRERVIQIEPTEIIYDDANNQK
ncbi:caveolin-3-like [Daphnia pulicaria]|uniref:caveolin-3-like n=1 Tax=Daphnia pulicaria TaxID=35523 RepID=UPI001EEA4658|nr:caveolin-3-like [Daphnia pulicaria]